MYINVDKDQYECTRGNKTVLPLKKQGPNSNGYIMKTYRSSELDCRDCPMRKICIGEKTKFKKIDTSIHKPLYDAMHNKLKAPYSKRLLRKRSSTVEPVLGTLLNFLNLKRVITRGIKQANKHVMMAALTYNLKKFLKFISKKASTKVQAMVGDHHDLLKRHFLNSFQYFVQEQNLISVFNGEKIG